jgi:succinoglycan biosynthesis protein ExoO
MTAAFLTIAIPTMRRWKYLKETLPTFLDREEVAEVIVCDETGEDIKQINATPLTQNPKLRCILNERVLGIYENKRKALSLAKTDWVAILDSDNYFLDEWFEVLIGAIDLADFTKIYASADFKMILL